MEQGTHVVRKDLVLGESSSESEEDVTTLSPQSPKQEVSSENDSSKSKPEEVLTRIFEQVATDQVSKEVSELKDALPELEDRGQATIDKLVEGNLSIDQEPRPTYAFSLPSLPSHLIFFSAFMCNLKLCVV